MKNSSFGNKYHTAKMVRRVKTEMKGHKPDGDTQLNSYQGQTDKAHS